MTEDEQNLMQNMMEGSGCSASEPFALRVLGDSMEPEFKDGCVIIIDPASQADHGSYVLAEIDGEYIFRQLIKQPEGLFLQPLNEGYEGVEIKDMSAIRGVIVQRAGTRRKYHKHYV